jgi:hypothetical protein
LAGDGAAVALWDVADGPGEALAQALREQGARALHVHCDVSRKAEVDAALAHTLAAFGHVDALVNNAGIFRAAAFLDVTEADWDAVIAVNLKGSFLVGQAVAPRHDGQCRRPRFRRHRQHRARSTAYMAIPSIASYNASKGAIDQLTRNMALSLADHRHPRQRGGAGHDRHRARARGRAHERGGRRAHPRPHAAAPPGRARRGGGRGRLPAQRRRFLRDRRGRVRGRRAPAR